MSNLNLGSFGDKRSSPRINADALSHLPKERRDWLEIFDDTKGRAAKVMPGTCSKCVWGEGEHSCCLKPMIVEEAWQQQAHEIGVK